MGCDAQLTSGEMSGNKCLGDLSVGNDRGRNVQISMQDYKSLCAAIMICATLVNTQIHTQTAFDQLCY